PSMNEGIVRPRARSGASDAAEEQLLGAELIAAVRDAEEPAAVFGSRSKDISGGKGGPCRVALVAPPAAAARGAVHLVAKAAGDSLERALAEQIAHWQADA